MDSYDRDDGKLKLKLQCHADGKKLMATKEGSRGPLREELAVGAKLNHGGVKYIRYQLPLIPAHCQTIHSSQGLTAKSDLVIEPSPSTPFEMALEYVAISRVTRLSHLHTLSPFRPIHFNYRNSYRQWISDEMNRLKQTLSIL